MASAAVSVTKMTRSQLRITILGLNYDPEPTGIAPYTTSLAEGLAAAGHEVRVLAGYPHYPEWRVRQGYSGWSRFEVLNGVRLHRLRHFVPAVPRTLNRLVLEVTFGLRLLCSKWGKPDVVLLVSPALISSAIAMTRVKLGFRRPKAVIWVQDIYSAGVVETGAATGWAAALTKKLESATLNSADGAVAIHDRFKHYLTSGLDLEEGAVRVVRNWTHLQTAPSVDKAAVRRVLGWKTDEVVVLHCGNMGAKQSLENVVEAAKIASSRNSPARFVLMGDGNQRATLQVSATGVGNLSFVDPLPEDEFQAAMAAADILLVNERPGVSEMAVPSKLTSYFSSGNPVVAATDAGSVTASEISTSGGGVRVDAGDPLALVLCVENLGADKDRCRELGQNGLKFREKTLTYAAAIQQYGEFLSELVTQKPSINLLANKGTNEKARFHYRHHRTGRIIPGGAVAAEGLRSPRSDPPGVDLQHGKDRPSLPRSARYGREAVPALRRPQ